MSDIGFNFQLEFWHWLILAAALAEPDLALAAVRAIAYRDRAAWTTRLQEVRGRYPGQDAIQLAIAQILDGR